MSRGLAEEVAERLREAAARPRWFTWEQYDEGGEIVRVDESPLRHYVPGQISGYLISGAGWAEPRTDWRERGVVPPEGIWGRAGNGSAPVRVR